VEKLECILPENDNALPTEIVLNAVSPGGASRMSARIRVQTPHQPPETILYDQNGNIMQRGKPNG
jgi:hypothetical protein